MSKSSSEYPGTANVQEIKINKAKKDNSGLDTAAVTGIRLIAVCVGLCLGNFVVALDTSIISASKYTALYHALTEIIF
jgi:hypothetical protein